MRCSVRVVFGAVAAVVACACATPFSSARDRGEEALARRDALTAIEQFQLACRFEPRDPVCTRAARMEAEAVAKALLLSAPQCEAGALEDCLDGLQGVRRVSSRPELLQLVESAARAHLARCDRYGASTPDDTVARVRCVEAFRARVGTAAYEQAIVQARQAAVRALEFAAQGRRAEGEAATAFAVGRLAECLAPSPFSSSTAASAAAQLKVDQQVPLVVELGAAQQRDATLCEAVAKQSRDRFRCADGRGATGVGLWLAATPQPVRHTQSAMVREVRYAAGVDTYRNQEHADLSHELGRDEARFDAADREYQLALADCVSAKDTLAQALNCGRCWQREQVVSFCNRAIALEDLRNRLAHEHNQTLHALNRTPDTVQSTRYETYRYTEQTHRWTQTFDLVARVVAPDGTRESSTRIEVAQEGVDRPGFEPAGVVPSAARAPTAEEMAGKIADRLVEHSWSALSGELERRESQRLASCKSGPRAEECRLRALWFRQPDIFVPYLAELRKRVDARKLPWPPVACTAGSGAPRP